MLGGKEESEQAGDVSHRCRCEQSLGGHFSTSPSGSLARLASFLVWPSATKFFRVAVEQSCTELRPTQAVCPCIVACQAFHSAHYCLLHR